MRYLARRVAAFVMSVTMMAAVFVGNGVTAFAIDNKGKTSMNVDLLIDDDTAHETTHKVTAGEDLTITGWADVSIVKQQLISGFQGDYFGIFYNNANDVKLFNNKGDSGVACWFTAKVTVPEGLVVDENNLDATMDHDMFEVADSFTYPRGEGTFANPAYDATTRTITIRMTLKNDYTTLKELLDAFDQLSDDQKFQMDITGISVPDDAKTGDQYQISASMGEKDIDRDEPWWDCRFWANYRYYEWPWSQSQPSSRWAVYSWTGVQLADGADSVAPDGINLTLEVVDAPVEPAAPAEEEHQRCHHKHRYWDVVKKGTQTEDGVMRYRCTDCGDVEYEVPIAAYYIFNKDTQQDILHAAPNATVTAKTPIFISFHEMVQEALVERPDVTLVVDYKNAGKNYEMTIPAGSGQTLDTLFGESQYAGFLYLGGAFATVEQ